MKEQWLDSAFREKFYVLVVYISARLSQYNQVKKINKKSWYNLKKGKNWWKKQSTVAGLDSFDEPKKSDCDEL